MKEASPNTIESSPKQAILPPVVESLLYPNAPENPLPEDIRNNPELQNQAEKRRLLLEKLSAFYKQVPDVEMDITEALESHLITEKEVSEVYDSFTNLLEGDPESNRILLYLPFELLPNERMPIETPELDHAKGRFISALKKEWGNLLAEHNLRADFVDGDVPEFEHRTGPLPQVVKAAHLIPVLVEKRLLSLDEVIPILEKTSDNILAQSIADTLPVLSDMKLIDDNTLGRMSQSENRLTANMAAIIQAQHGQEKEADAHEPPLDLQTIMSHLKEDREHIYTQYQDHSNNRNKWLGQRALEHMNKIHAHDLYLSLTQNIVSLEALESYVASHKDADAIESIVFALREAVEQEAKRDTSRAIEKYSDYESLLINLWENNDNEKVREALKGTFYHFSALGIAINDTLEHLGIPPHSLNTSFSNQSPEVQKDFTYIREAAAGSLSNPELSKYIYPAALILGSQIKGYGTHEADLDIAVFVRPGVNFEVRENLQKAVKQTFVHEKIQSQPMEFWLKEDGGKLSAQDFENPDTALGDSTLAHPLLGGWVGDEAAIRELHERLLPDYLYSKGKTILGKDARRVWLEEIEHNILQYRLMHKGYKRFFPERGGINTPHSDGIDSESSFYDSGYRRLATQLFLKKVFLPQLKKPTA